MTYFGGVYDGDDSDVKAALRRLKPEVALYVGGMGHRNKNFHKDMMTRRGFGDAADRIQELYLAGRKEEATDAVPDEWVDEKSLVGPPERVKQRYRRWDRILVSGLQPRWRCRSCSRPQYEHVVSDLPRQRGLLQRQRLPLCRNHVPG